MNTRSQKRECRCLRLREPQTSSDLAFLPRAHLAAFTLIEVMFSVITLGIGLVMIAAMFPVAIAQTQSNSDETTGAATARSAISMLTQCFAGQQVPDTNGTVQPLPDSLRAVVYGNLINPSDPRYAWVPLYRKNAGEQFAQVIVLVVRNRNHSTYTPGVDLPVDPNDTTGSGATLDAKSVGVTLQDGGAQLDRVRFEMDDVANSPARIASGTFVIVSSPAGAAGRIYRVGDVQDAATNTWTLAPGWDMVDASEDVSGASAYVIGRGYVDPTDPSKGYDGPAQDVAVYTAIVQAN